MKEYDVTPEEQGSNCKYAGICEFYRFGIYCNRCNQYEEPKDYYEE